MMPGLRPARPAPPVSGPFRVVRPEQPAADGYGPQVRWTTRVHGDQAGTDEGAEARRRSVVDRPWTVLRQVHGARVIEVERPGDGHGAAADASVTTEEGAVLAVLTADCAPVVFRSPQGVIGVAHAGWRGLLAGVIEATAAAMRRLGAIEITAEVGPCIHVECYPFAESDMSPIVAEYGSTVRGVDRHGHPALDLPAGVEMALQRAGSDASVAATRCTACAPDLYSWRAGRDPQRQAAVVWQ